MLGQFKLSQLGKQALLGIGQFSAMAFNLLLKWISGNLRGDCRGGLGRFLPGQLLDAAVAASADPDDQNQANNDPDDIGDNVQERIKTEGYFPHAAATSHHGNWPLKAFLVSSSGSRFSLLMDRPSVWRTG